MKPPGYDEYLRMYMEMVRFAKDEHKRREQSPVHIPKEKIDREFMGHNWVLLVDPRIGFNSRIIRFWINGFPPGEAENQWKSMGHRHTVEAVIYVLKGHGYSIIEDHVDIGLVNRLVIESSAVVPSSGLTVRSKPLSRTMD